MPDFDAHDQEILLTRQAMYDEIHGVRVGDWVRFADGTLRRVSHIWREDADPVSVQTSDGGSFYLGDRYVSFSGGLHPGIDPATLTPTDEAKSGSCWFFHHDWARAGGAVSVTIPFRVFTTTLDPN
jgi:hypothetical protein